MSKPGMSTRPLSSSSSGISKRIQNKLKSDSLARNSHSANGFKSEDIISPTTNPSFEMSSSAAIVANALELSRNRNNGTQTFKSNSVTNLRKKSPPQASVTPGKVNGRKNTTIFNASNCRSGKCTSPTRYVSLKFKLVLRSCKQ